MHVCAHPSLKVKLVHITVQRPRLYAHQGLIIASTYPYIVIGPPSVKTERAWLVK